jgi:hypothetical protein
MVCGCSWSMKIYERSVAMSGSGRENGLELLKDDAAQFLAELAVI